MFFIVPDPRQSPGSSPGDTTKASAPSEASLRTQSIYDGLAGYYPKRAPKACNRCRLKKTRCSLRSGPCAKCVRDGVVCVTTANDNKAAEKRAQNPAYVHMVEAQRDTLVQALKKVWKNGNAGELCARQDLNTILEQIGALTAAANKDTLEADASLSPTGLHHYSGNSISSSSAGVPEGLDPLNLDGHAPNAVPGNSDAPLGSAAILNENCQIPWSLFDDLAKLDPELSPFDPSWLQGPTPNWDGWYAPNDHECLPTA